MPQINDGIRSILEKGYIYNFFQWLIGGKKARQRYIEEFVRPKPQNTLLDIGCGPGTIFNCVPETIKYYGVDISAEYIQHAQQQFGDKATFICSDANNSKFLKDLPKFDLVIAFGLLHHLDDNEVVKLLQLAKQAMNPHGRLITLDNCYTDNQSSFAKYTIKRDRGQNVRTVDGYESLAKTTFLNIKTTVLHDMLRIPYTHIIMECSNG